MRKTPKPSLSETLSLSPPARTSTPAPPHQERRPRGVADGVAPQQEQVELDEYNIVGLLRSDRRHCRLVNLRGWQATPVERYCRPSHFPARNTTPNAEGSSLWGKSVPPGYFEDYRSCSKLTVVMEPKHPVVEPTDCFLHASVGYSRASSFPRRKRPALDGYWSDKGTHLCSSRSAGKDKAAMGDTAWSRGRRRIVAGISYGNVLNVAELVSVVKCPG